MSVDTAIQSLEFNSMCNTLSGPKASPSGFVPRGRDQVALPLRHGASSGSFTSTKTVPYELLEIPSSTHPSMTPNVLERTDAVI